MSRTPQEREAYVKPQLPEGYAVEFHYYVGLTKRPVEDQGGRVETLFTRAEIISEDDGKIVGGGTAILNPGDRFNANIAQDISLGRALKQFRESHPIRIGFVCCICSGDVGTDEALGVSFFPAQDVDSAQQFWAHPRCALDALDIDAHLLRPELAQRMFSPQDLSF